MKNLFLLSAAKLYKKQKKNVRHKDYQKIYKALQQLYPLGNTEKLLESFNIRKIAVMLCILLIGIVSAVCFHLCSRMENRLAEGAQLIRNEWGVGDYKITLRAKTGSWSRVIPFLVEERTLTGEEQDILQKELYAQLPDLIKKENTDLAHVVGELNLLTSVPGYPFYLTWDSSDSDRLSSKGKVNRKGIITKEKINLTVTLLYEQNKASYTYEIILLPEELNEEEGFYRALENKLSAINLEGKEKSKILLPVTLEGKRVEWEEVRADNTILIILLTVSGCIMAGRGMERDLKKSCIRRNRQLAAEYSEFVSKFRLYLSAGLTVKNAFYRIMADYENQQEQSKRKYLYEEMKVSCHQLENGVMEEQVYREFGRRCGETRYRRLSFLLTVHLKQGSGQLLTLLSEEAEGALEDRRNMAKKAGEEAGTKLLLPMMLMLTVVMFLILLPAYLNFGGI